MKYSVCSLAVGDTYFNNMNTTCKKILGMSTFSECLIATDKTLTSIDRLTYVDVGDIPVSIMNGKFFNYNLKFFPIKQSINLNVEFIVYIDGDWGVLDTYTDDKFLQLFNIMKDNNIDFVFERPHDIGLGKTQGSECFWGHKIEYYDLLNTTKYDKGHVCNEQCMVFKNNDKLKIFINFWEKLFWKTYQDNLWPFAEGLEIGMSTVEADMNCSWQYISLLSRCFSFYSKDGGYNERF